MRLVPISFYFCPVCKSNDSESFFTTIREIALVFGSIIVVVSPLSILLSPTPHPLVNVSIRVFHNSLSTFDIVSPLPFVDIPICIEICSKTMLSTLGFDGSSKALPIFKQIGALNERILLPQSEVDVSLRVNIHSQPISFLTNDLHSSIIYTFIVIFLNRETPFIKFYHKFLQLLLH